MEVLLDSCKFCDESADVFIENEHWRCIYDKYPVTEGHTLIIGKRHTMNYFECTQFEKRSLIAILDLVKIFLEKTYKPDGFNIGMNIGEAGGQTIRHTHIHVIPRYLGDSENPRGGVRGVIPSKQDYYG